MFAFFSRICFVYLAILHARFMFSSPICDLCLHSGHKCSASLNQLQLTMSVGVEKRNCTNSHAQIALIEWAVMTNRAVNSFFFQSNESSSSMCLELALEGERLCKSGDCRAGVAFFQVRMRYCKLPLIKNVPFVGSDSSWH